MNVKKLGGILIVLAGVLLGIWLGIVVMLVGGIIQGVHGVTAHPVNGTDIGWGVVRVLFSGFVGWVSGLLVVAVGMSAYDEGVKQDRRERNRNRYGWKP